MLLHGRADAAQIGAAAVAGVGRLVHLFRAVQDHPHRPRRTAAAFGNGLGRRQGDGPAGPVVDGTRTEVPAVHMRAQDDDFLRPRPAGNVADHILADRLIGVGRRGQAQAHRLPHFDQARDRVGIRRGKGEARQGHDTLDIAGGAGVRHAVLVRSDRAHDEGHGPLGRSRRGTRTPDARQRAIARAVLHPHHLAGVDIGDLAGQRARRGRVQGLKAVKQNDIGLDNAIGAGRMAEGRQHQPLRPGPDDRAAFLAPLPADQRELFDPHILEAMGPHIVGGPGRGVLLGLRPRRPRAEPRRQLGDIVEGDIPAQRRVADGLGPLDGRGILRHSGCRHEGQGQGAGGEKANGQTHDGSGTQTGAGA